MKFLKRLLLILVLPAFSLILISWGSTGHYKINLLASLSFNQEMSQFYDWTYILANHASDADYRKQTDPTEAPKHYIDIDNYPEFIASGRIPQTLDSVIALYGSSFVWNQGILPWATRITYDSLQDCFERNDWEKAVLFASDLGHYVADGHMPLHITNNYNGQMTGNNGIHSRYESTMVNDHATEIVYDGWPIEAVEDVDQYIFDYLYANYIYVDSILAADDYAYSISSNTYSYEYKQALWESTKGFTTTLFSNASHSLTELIYTAWVEAGSPSMLGISDLFEGKTQHLQLMPNVPNPFSSNTRVEIDLVENTEVTLEVIDLRGNRIDMITNQKHSKGKHSFNWYPKHQPSGVYYLVLKAGNIREVRKMMLVD